MPPADFSPELTWLLALLRCALDGAAAPPPPGGLDWKKFLALAERHRVGAWLAQRMAAHLSAVCPEEVVLRLKAVAAANTRRALVQTAEQIRLARLLEAAGIGVLAVKGLVLAQQLHGRLGARHVGDIDLAVQPADVARADALLQAAGLRRSWPAFPLTPRQTEKFLQIKPEFEYIRAAPAMRIELLWRFEGLSDDQPVWPDAVSCTLGGHAFRTLPPTLNVPFLFQHGARHAWFRLFWLVDAALLLRDPTVPWAEIVAAARRHGTERALLQAAALAETLFGVAPPPALRPTAAEAATVSALVSEACRQIVRDPAAHEAAGEWARQTVYRAHLARGAGRKFAALVPHLFSPLSWQTLPLPDRWFFLYYPAAPVLWLWRRWRRAPTP